MGKSTLAKKILDKHKNAIYLDLKKASDHQKVESEPELFLEINKDKLICIDEMNDLLGHPVFGSSFESYIIENIISHCSRFEFSFYRDNHGNEVDLILKKGNRLIAIEIKASKAPKMEKGFWNSVNYLNPTEMWAISMIDNPYRDENGLEMTNLEDFIKRFKF